MLIYKESGCEDVVITDSISQRSLCCDHILPLTDGVSLTSALWQSGCHKKRRQHPWSKEPGCLMGLNIPVIAENFIESLCSEVAVLFHHTAWCCLCREEGEAYSSPILTAKPWNAAIQHYLHIAESPAVHYPNKCLSGELFRAAGINTAVFSCAVIEQKLKPSCFFITRIWLGLSDWQLEMAFLLRIK